ncbi:hypothetical protein ABH935_007015 [Catenulispora sp. GAS73]|uniref:hypothetical protein n=1 Tax=Catenulispora sp. GAS73 TaxID=3156269 RepID=UPI003512157A
MSVPPGPTHPTLPPGWHHPPPLLPVTVDRAAEVVLRVTRDARGVVDAPSAHMRREPGGPAEPAAVVAWARPPGTSGWPWVLPVWMDAWRAPGNSSTQRTWRCVGWLVYDPLLLESVEPARRPTEYWLEQRAKAIAEAVVRAGLGGAGQR